MLGEADIHLWQIDLTHDAWDVHSVALSDAEMQRYACMRDVIKRKWHQRARIALRLLLGRYMNLDACDVRITSVEQGKPHAMHSHVHFNLSHSHSRALIGVSLTPLGVDLERVDTRDGLESLLKRVCHPLERPAFAGIDAASIQNSFYRLWVCKEAYCKAIGEGLRKPMDSFRILQRNDQSCYEVIDPDGDERRHLLHCLPVGDGWAAALCSTNPEPRLMNFLDYEFGSQDGALFDVGPRKDRS